MAIRDNLNGNIEALRKNITNPFTYKGAIEYEVLQTITSQKIGDTYYVTDKKRNYTWNGVVWGFSSFSELDYMEELNALQAEIENVNSQLSNEIDYVSENLLNGSAEEVVYYSDNMIVSNTWRDGIALSDTGEILDRSNLSLSDFIEVSSDKNYIYFRAIGTSDAYGLAVNYFDDEKNFVSRLTSAGLVFMDKFHYVLVTPPEKCRYIKLMSYLDRKADGIFMELKEPVTSVNQIRSANTTLVYKQGIRTNHDRVERYEHYSKNNNIKYGYSPYSIVDSNGNLVEDASYEEGANTTFFLSVGGDTSLTLLAHEHWAGIVSEYDKEKNFLRRINLSKPGTLTTHEKLTEINGVTVNVGETSYTSNSDVAYIRISYHTMLASEFYVKPTDSFVFDNYLVEKINITTKININSNSSQGFNLKDFGAIGDGVNDDSVAFNKAMEAIAALETGGVLYVPDGVYKMNNKIEIFCDKVSIESAGAVFDFSEIPQENAYPDESLHYPCIAIRTKEIGNTDDGSYSNLIRKGQIYYCKGIYFKGNSNVSGAVFNSDIVGRMAEGFNFEHCVFTGFHYAVIFRSQSWCNGLIACNISANNTGIYVPSGGSNYCERITVMDSNIHSCEVGVVINWEHAHAHFIGCSFDYNHNFVTLLSGRVYLTNCHCEVTSEKDTNYTFIVDNAKSLLALKNCEFYYGHNNYNMFNVIKGMVDIDTSYMHRVGYSLGTWKIGDGTINTRSLYGGWDGTPVE